VLPKLQLRGLIQLPYKGLKGKVLTP
jgi:hypothetical protein